MGALSLGQGVLVTDARHQVPQASHPGAGLLGVGGNQVERFHVVPVVNGEATGGIEASFSVAVEDV